MLKTRKNLKTAKFETKFVGSLKKSVLRPTVARSWNEMILYFLFNDFSGIEF